MQKKALIIFCFSLVASASAQNRIYAHVTLTELDPTAQNAIWSRTKNVMPAYPVDMAMKGIAGCGVFKISIDAEGDTKNIELIRSVPAARAFKAAKKDLKKWRWHNISGKANAAEEKTLRLDYCLGGSSEAEAAARCEIQVKARCRD